MASSTAGNVRVGRPAAAGRAGQTADSRPTGSKLAKGEQALETEQQLQQKLATDKGFQDSLSLYQTLPGKQVKTIFMGLDDETVVRYLQAMPPRTSAKIVKEFKSPDETDRIQRVLERMRQSQPQQPQPPQTQPETLPPSAAIETKNQPPGRARRASGLQPDRSRHAQHQPAEPAELRRKIGRREGGDRSSVVSKFLPKKIGNLPFERVLDQKQQSNLTASQPAPSEKSSPVESSREPRKVDPATKSQNRVTPTSSPKPRSRRQAGARRPRRSLPNQSPRKKSRGRRTCRRRNPAGTGEGEEPVDGLKPKLSPPNHPPRRPPW